MRKVALLYVYFTLQCTKLKKLNLLYAEKSERKGK